MNSNTEFDYRMVAVGDVVCNILMVAAFVILVLLPLCYGLLWSMKYWSEIWLRYADKPACATDIGKMALASIAPLTMLCLLVAGLVCLIWMLTGTWLIDFTPEKPNYFWNH